VSVLFEKTCPTIVLMLVLHETLVIEWRAAWSSISLLVAPHVFSRNLLIKVATSSTVARKEQPISSFSFKRPTDVHVAKQYIVTVTLWPILDHQWRPPSSHLHHLRWSWPHGPIASTTRMQQIAHERSGPRVISLAIFLQEREPFRRRPNYVIRVLL
jgi:hypothetical protein